MEKLTYSVPLQRGTECVCCSGFVIPSLSPQRIFNLRVCRLEADTGITNPLLSCFRIVKPEEQGRAAGVTFFEN